MRKLVLIFGATVSKAIAFPLGFSPFPTSCLITGSLCSRTATLLITICSSLLADSILAFIKGYPIIGYWSLFTQTGFLWIAFSGKNLWHHYDSKKGWQKLTFIFKKSIVISLGFWLWTVFGVWLFEPFYAKNINGLLQCYTVALPFLNKALLGNLFWLGTLLTLRIIKNYVPKKTYPITSSLKTLVK